MARGWRTNETDRVAVLKQLSRGQSYQQVTDTTGMPRSTVAAISGRAMAAGKLKSRPVGRPCKST